MFQDRQCICRINFSYANECFTVRDTERNIYSNPFKRLEDMRFMKRSKEIEYVEFNKNISGSLPLKTKNGLFLIVMLNWQSILNVGCNSKYLQ